MSLVNLAMFTATLAGKGEEPSSPSSLSSEASSLLNSISSFSSTFPSFSPSDMPTIITSSEMPNQNSHLTFQQLNSIPSTLTNEENSINTNPQENKDTQICQSPIHQRRLPLPTKLSFEQNITNLIEKESPLLQSELLTAEHELSVLRSRLAVNEGVTAVTGTILESLKEQFQSQHKIDRPTSPIDIYPPTRLQQSSSIQTSPSLEALPESLEIHYDAESPKTPYFIIKAINSFWLAQPIPNSDVQNHLKKFSSPVMKRASFKLPDDFDFDDIDKDSISDENENSTIDRQEQLAEMKTIRSSSLLHQIDQFEKFDNKIDEIYSSIDQFKHHKLTQKILNNLQEQIHQLKFLTHDIPCIKQDELRLEYEFDELENLFNQTLKHEDYDLIELFEQNLNELQHIIEQIKNQTSPSQGDLITEFENQLETIQHKSKPSYTRLIPENPVVTKDVFFEGDKISKRKKVSPSNIIRLIPEDPQINASSFYEGDIHRSFYPHPPEQEKKVLIPEKPTVSSEVFYEGDAQRSMFIERPFISHSEHLSSSSSPLISIDNLREIMSDLMLAASWSKKPPRLEKQQTKEDVEIQAESFITTEEQHTKSPVYEITHEIENFSVIHPAILVEENEGMVITDESSDNASTVVSFPVIERENSVVSEEYDNLLIQKSDQIVEQVLNEIISDEQNHLYHPIVGHIGYDVMGNSLNEQDEELQSIKSSSTSSDSDDDEESSENYSVSDDEENENLIPQISDQPYLFVTDVVTSKSTQELGNLVQELHVLEHQIPHVHPLSSSSSSSLSDNDENQSLNLSIPQITTTKSVHELTNLVSELHHIEEQLEDKLDSPHATNQSPISSKSFNELGGLINELKTVSNRLHEEIFTSNNIALLSQDIVKYRRDSLPITTDPYLHTKESIAQTSEQYDSDENQLVQDMVAQIIKEAQDILRRESSFNIPSPTVKSVPTIIVDERRLRSHQLSTTSISEELSFEDNTSDRTFELAAQLDYLRRMSRYENLIDQPEQLETILPQTRNEEQSSSDDDDHHPQQLEISRDSINQHSTDSLDYHSTEDIEQNPSTTIFDRVKSLINKPVEILQDVIENRFNTEHVSPQQQHFQSAYDLHDEEKSKLVRSPELYNMDNMNKHDQQALLTNSQIQYRTLSESALAMDDSKRHSVTATSNETSVEFLTTISNEDSSEFMQQQRLPTPFDDVLEKESSPEHSESYPIPTSAFSDTLEPTSSCQRPLAFCTSNQQRPITELEYHTVANDLVNQVLNDVIIELMAEEDNDSSLSHQSDKLSSSSNSTSSDDNDEHLEEEDETLINNDRYVKDESTSPKTSTRSSLSKTLRRAQTDTADFAIVQSPITLIPPIIRRNSQSDTETYFHAVSPSIDNYLQIDNSSSDEKPSPPTRHLSIRHKEKYSGEGEDSSGGKERIIQRRKRSNDITNPYESPSIKNLSFKFETNDHIHRQESLDSPPMDSNEKTIFKILQEGILRTNLETFQIDLKFTNSKDEYLQEKTYSSTTRLSSSYYDYDGGSETDRDETKRIPIHQKSSIDSHIKNLLGELIETIHDDLSISSQSDATTVICNSNTTSLDDEDTSHDRNLIEKECLSSSSHTVIYHHQNFTPFVNTNARKQSSIPTLSNSELSDYNTKKKFRSSPGSLIPLTSIPTTSTTFQSGQQQFDE